MAAARNPEPETLGRYRVLGGNLLQVGEKQLSPERKTAAVLTYLALEGPTSRSKLAGFLWPDSSESAARNNLSQTLRRLKSAADAQVISGSDVLRLESLVVDAAELKVLAFSGKSAEVLALAGELLPHFDYDDCPDFADWLYSERERLQGLRREALVSAATALEAQGQFKQALACAEKLLELELASEEAHRLIMRLHYLSGDRAAALKAYRRCRDILLNELGVEPLLETEELACRIEAGAEPRQPAPKEVLPVEVLRPPKLVGREEAWAQMERAWAAGQLILLSGEPGVGKTRLALEFAASKGRFIHLEGRPGDKTVPFATHGRNLRRFLESQPGLKLAPWVRRELSRILPELGAPGAEPPPLVSEADKLRFYDAASELIRLCSQNLAVAVADDMHFYDAASRDYGAYLISRFYPLGQPGGMVRFIDCYPAGELPPDTEAVVDELVASGIAARIEVTPLPLGAVGDLVGSLGLEGSDKLASPLSHYTGGNPFFVVETLKHLLETNALGGDFPAHLPPPGRIGALINRRLDHLSPSALRLMRVAAIAQADFSLELAGRVLEAPLAELVEDWGQLERSGMLKGGWFSHGLLYQTTLQAMPNPVKTLLHRRVLEALEEVSAAPAVLAKHALAADLPARAFRYSLAAADGAMRLFALKDATAHFERAHELVPRLSAGSLETLPVADLRRLYYQLGFAYVYSGQAERARQLFTSFLAFARAVQQPALEWTAYNNLAYLAVHEAQEEVQVTVLAQEALRAAERSGEPGLLAEAESELSGLYCLIRRPELALPHAERAQVLARELGDKAILARALTELEIAKWKLARRSESETHLEETLALYRALGNGVMEARTLWTMAYNSVALGQAEAGLQRARQALSLSAGLADRRGQVNALGVMALALSELGRYEEALELGARSVAMARELGVPLLTCLSLIKLGAVQLELGLLDDAEASLLSAHDLNKTVGQRQPSKGEIAAHRCRLMARRGHWEEACRLALEALNAPDYPWVEPWVPRWVVTEALLRGGYTAEAEADARRYKARIGDSPRHRLVLLRCQAVLMLASDPAAAVQQLEEAKNLAENLGLPGVRYSVEAALAKARARAGESDESLSSRVKDLLQSLADAIRDEGLRATFLAAAAV